MLIADWVVLGLLILFALLGLFLGFSKGLRFITKGFFGFIISIFICYSLGGLIIKIGFVQTLLDKFVALLTDKGTFCDILLAIRIDIIVYYVVLFIIVQILRIIIVKLISKILETKNVFLKIINSVLGVAIYIGILVLFAMIVFQVVYMIGGTTAGKFTSLIAGSKLKLDWFYEHNPLMTIVEYLFRIEIKVPVVVS